MSNSDISLPRSDGGGTAAAPHTVAFLLVPGFSLLSYACAIEPYRAANHLSGRRLYRWLNVSPDGGPVHASNGLAVVPDQGLAGPLAADDLFVCAGGNPALFADEATFSWMRTQAQHGLRIGGISGGPYILARAGLLDGHRFTVHWEHAPALLEEFPHLAITGALFEIDRARLTAAGGTAALDLMVALIAIRSGDPLARAVADWFLHTPLRAAVAPQRMPPSERHGVTHPALATALAHMDAAIETPLQRVALARLARVSVRQLERLFRAQLGRSIGRHYLELRLARAKTLLDHTDMPVIEVALATGFVSAAHFSRACRARFGAAPRDLRARTRSPA